MSTPKKILSGWSSTAIHARDIAPPLKAHLNPVFATSTFSFDTAEEGMERFAGKEKQQIYSRWGNPGFREAEAKISSLEAFGLQDSSGNPLELKTLLHASGQAALSTCFFSNLKAGDTVLSHPSLYGGTHELFHKVLAEAGVTTIIVDLHDLEKAETVFQENKISLLHIETPANPTIQCFDIEALSAMGKRYHAVVSVDNTFATPYLQQPFKFDVDFVVHSTTKFLNGHGTAIGGALVGRDIEFMKTKAWKWYALLGGNANPFDAFLLAQGMKTLEIRMMRHCENAMQVAHFLDDHRAVAKVNYNGLEHHPDFELSRRQMRHPGPMMSFELKGGIEAGKKFIDALQMCTRAVSLGTLDTLLSHPASMSHAGLKPEEREEYGITDGLIRMSTGIENIEDILSDLDQALTKT